MRKNIFVIAVFILMTTAKVTFAWNSPGHMAVAKIAYERLTPAKRIDVDALLLNHPRYNTWLTIAQSVVPANQTNKAIFMLAATWSDEVRGDSLFYDDVKHEAPKPLADGYIDMAKHTNWHYVDITLSQDGTQPPDRRPVAYSDAITSINTLAPDIGSTENYTRKVCELPWLLHLIGDVHQPLHCCSRYSVMHPDGDAGGNGFLLAGHQNLHSYWDDLFAPGYDYHRPEHQARDLATTFRTPTPVMDAATQRLLVHERTLDWVIESYNIAKSFVYTVGPESTTVHPKPSPQYTQKARHIAGQRIVLAGYRLAAVLGHLDLR